MSAELDAYRQIAQDMPDMPIGKAFALVESMKAAGREAGRAAARAERATAKVARPKSTRAKRKRSQTGSAKKRTGGTSSQRVQEVVDWLKNTPGDHLVREIAEGLNRHRSTIRAAVIEAQKQGLVRVTRTERGPGGERRYYTVATLSTSLVDDLVAGAKSRNEAEAVPA